MPPSTRRGSEGGKEKENFTPASRAFKPVNPRRQPPGHSRYGKLAATPGEEAGEMAVTTTQPTGDDWASVLAPDGPCLDTICACSDGGEAATNVSLDIRWDAVEARIAAECRDAEDTVAGEAEVTDESTLGERTGAESGTDEPHDTHAGIISQLESQVASLNFDLATAKSSLDELKLENRKLAGDRSRLQEENERLVKKIEQLQRGNVIRQGAQGSAQDQRSNISGEFIASGDVDDIDGGTAEQQDENTSNDEIVVLLEFNRREENDAVVDGDECHEDQNPLDDDDPFATWSASPKTRPSLSSVDSALDQQSTSNSEESIAPGDEDDIDGGTAEQQDETKEVEEQSGTVRKDGEVSVPLEFIQRENDAVVDEDDCYEDSNPLNDDDPFASWRAPGDPIRESEPSRNWLGPGGGNRNRRPAEPQGEAERPPDDPFDTTSEADDGGGLYEPFSTRNPFDHADNSTVRTGGIAPQDRGGRFGLFGFGQRRA